MNVMYSCAVWLILKHIVANFPKGRGENRRAPYTCAPGRRRQVARDVFNGTRWYAGTVQPQMFKHRDCARTDHRSPRGNKKHIDNCPCTLDSLGPKIGRRDRIDHLFHLILSRCSARQRGAVPGVWPVLLPSRVEHCATVVNERRPVGMG